MSRSISSALTALALVFAADGALAATLTVGPSGTYAAPCAAFAAASDGDVVEIDAAGDYGGDVCQFNVDNLTIRGMGGRAVMDATSTSIPNGKAIWVIQGNDTVVENIEFTGASVNDQNGAGIRQEGTNLTVRNCYFHDNEDGILAGDDDQSEILIEYTEFGDNGAGDGQSHNFYINHVAKFTLQYCYSHSAIIGHLAKTRAHENYILYNRLTGEDGTQSYELDVPNAGLTYVIGNLFHQGPNTDNSGMLSYGAEGASNPSDELFVVNNTFVNDRSAGTFISVGGGVSTPVIVRNNIFVGNGTHVTQGSAVEEGSCTDDPLFVNQAGFDWQLTNGSPCAEAGVDPGSGAGMSLNPDHHYVHPASQEGRIVVGTIDSGAYELGGGVAGAGGGGAGGGAVGGAGTGGGGTAGTGGTSTGGTGTGGAGAAPVGGDPEEDDGCGCRAAGHGPSSHAAWLALLAVPWLRRSRRARH